MRINELLAEKGVTRYRLAKESGLPQTTVTDICSGKARIECCSGETLYKLARTLDVSMESLLADVMEYRPSFEMFKNDVCNHVRDMGDLDFIIDTLETGEIRKLWDKQWYPEALYLLAMVDYLSRENDLPLCADYADVRRARLTEPLYASGAHSASTSAIPEFSQHNIIEAEVRYAV
ncbi:hypothetical protein FACS1894208_11870 [Clostridia bacterium]|nr:hypothetical protein FACS1894208_11870 [Clostridia bacterium]